MKQIRWVIQNNLSAEGGDYHKLSKACEELGIESQGIQVIPFSPDLPEFAKDDKINIYYGATTLMYNIYHQLNRPEGLFFDEERFSMEKYMKIWGEHMLNSGAKITTFDEFISETHDGESIWFIRPDADDKSFNGTTMTFREIKEWSSAFQIVDNVTLNGQTKIVVGEPYNISKEWRNYIVDGKVVTSSRYRENFRLSKSAEDIPDGMIKFVEERCSEYMPHKIFAMDVALCGGEYYIIECGCMNSVGLYAADVGKFVKSISDYVSNN